MTKRKGQEWGSEGKGHFVPGEVYEGTLSKSEAMKSRGYVWDEEAGEWK